MYGNLSTTTATSEINENVESMSRFLTTNRNIELLEPYEGKLSCTVLRGEGGSNALDLPDEKMAIGGNGMKKRGRILIPESLLKEV